jgi:phosphoribosyl 1,2-cyclic phosphate phosphodiesterase
MSLLFLGTGTSQGVPIIGCTCAVCLSANAKDKRTRSSVLLTVNNKKILIDLSPDFRHQMLENQQTNVDFVLMTHEHRDHTGGLDDLRPICFKYEKSIPIYGQIRVLEVLEKHYDYVFKEIDYPGRPRVSLHQIIENQPQLIEGVEVMPISVWHGQLPIVGYRFGNSCYLTDVSSIDKASADWLEGLDTLILNALQIDPHYSHFNLAEALAFVDLIKPKRTYLTHISHNLGLHNALKLPPNVFLAYDGLKIDF